MSIEKPTAKEYWSKYSYYLAGGLLGLLLFTWFSKCDPDTVTIEKPTVQTKVVRYTDTVLRTIEITNRIYIPISEPTLNTAERVTLDTVIRKDSAEAMLHVEFNKVSETWENVMAAFTVPVTYKEYTKYVDRETTIEVPIPTEDTDDFQWFGLGSLVGVLLTIIGVLAL